MFRPLTGTFVARVVPTAGGVCSSACRTERVGTEWIPIIIGIFGSSGTKLPLKGLLCSFGGIRRPLVGCLMDKVNKCQERSLQQHIYVRPGNMTLVAIASWDAANATVSLAIDWDSIGLLRQRASVIAPHIPGFNRHDRSRVLRQEDVQGRITLTVPAHEGWFLIIK